MRVNGDIIRSVVGHHGVVRCVPGMEGLATANKLLRQLSRRLIE